MFFKWKKMKQCLGKFSLAMVGKKWCLFIYKLLSAVRVSLRFCKSLERLMSYRKISIMYGKISILLCFVSLSVFSFLFSYRTAVTMNYYDNWRTIVSLTRRWLTGQEAINLNFEDEMRRRNGYDGNIITCY